MLKALGRIAHDGSIDQCAWRYVAGLGSTPGEIFQNGFYSILERVGDVGKDFAWCSRAVLSVSSSDVRTYLANTFSANGGSVLIRLIAIMDPRMNFTATGRFFPRNSASCHVP